MTGGVAWRRLRLGVALAMSALALVLGCATTPAAASPVNTVLNVGQGLATGDLGSAVGAAAGAAGSTVTSLALAGMGAWVLEGARSALGETAKVMGSTTTPQLTSTWFSGTYWRMAGIAAVLTLPFLFAAAIQALVQSDLGLLARAGVIYLPLATLAVSIAAPLTMLLLAASDELSAIVSSAAGDASGRFLTAASAGIADLTALSGSPFLAFLIGVFTVAGAVVLWIELLMREAAVYVIVLMLPVAFSAFVWPARRIWAVRTLELLVALILSKFAIVAVLSLGSAALGSSTGQHGVARWLAGLVLVVMAAFMPWALLRFVPLAEAVSGAAGSLRHDLRSSSGAAKVADLAARAGQDWVARTVAQMRNDSGQLSVPQPPAPQAAEEPTPWAAEEPSREARAGAPAESDDGEMPVAAAQAARVDDAVGPGQAEETSLEPRNAPEFEPVAWPKAPGQRPVPEQDVQPSIAELADPGPGTRAAEDAKSKPWNDELLDTPDLSRVFRLGGRPAGEPPHKIERRRTADDPDPLPPAQADPERAR